MSKPPLKLTPARARKDLLQPKKRGTSLQSFGRVLHRLRQVSPALLEYQLRRVLTDPTMDPSERDRMAAALSRFHLDAEDRAAQHGLGEETERVPETSEEIARLEAEADRLQKARITSYEERKRKAQEARSKALAEAASGTPEEAADE